MDEESRNIGENIPESEAGGSAGNADGGAERESSAAGSSSEGGGKTDHAPVGGVYEDTGNPGVSTAGNGAAPEGESSADASGDNGGFHRYSNENTGNFSNGGGHWGTYEDWNFGILEDKKEGSGQTAGKKNDASGSSRSSSDNASGNVSGSASGSSGNASGSGYSGPQYGYAGNSDYHSPYDSYRFESPDIDYGGSGTGGGDGRKPPKERGGIKTVLITAIITAAVVLGIYFGIRAARRPLSGRDAASSESTNSGTEIVLGNEDDAEASSSDTESITELDPDAVSSGAEETDTDGELTTTEVVEKVMPSMVAITNTTMEQYWNIYGQLQSSESVSAGSGIIVGRTDENLLIATNNHVISDSDDITVTFNDDSPATGTVLGSDADNDLAIVAVSLNDISSDTLDAIAIVSIGDSDEVKVGQSVVAIGNALGYGQSVSKGIISALNREVTDSDGTTRTLIQTDASINPGNSGGALLNMKGELIGINEAKYVDETVEGVGYAIPMDTAEPILRELGSRTARSKVSDDQASYLGVSVVTMPSSYTSQGYPAGAYVASVVSGGPADTAGIKEGDIITSFDGTSVSSKEELVERLTYYAAGEQVEVSVSRLNDDRTAYEKERVTVTLGNKSEMSTDQDTQRSAESTAARRDGYGDDSRGGFFGF